MRLNNVEMLNQENVKEKISDKKLTEFVNSLSL